MNKKIALITSMLLLVLVCGCTTNEDNNVLPHHQIGSKMDTTEWSIDISDSSPYKHQFGISDFHGNVGMFRMESSMDDDAIGDVVDEDMASDMGLLFYNFCQQTIYILSDNLDDYGSTTHTFNINEFRLAVYDLDRDIVYEDIESDFFRQDEFVTNHTLKNYVVIRQIFDTVQDGKCVHVVNEVRHNSDWS